MSRGEERQCHVEGSTGRASGCGDRPTPTMTVDETARLGDCCGLTKTGEPRTDGKEGVNHLNGQYVKPGKGEQNQAGRVHKWVPKGK